MSATPSVKPLFATPCYGGVVTWQYATAMVNAVEAFQAAGIPFRTYMTGGDSIVDRARNDCVAEFLEGDCTHLFFVDADIAFCAQDAMDMLTSGLDFVLGSYRKKTETEQWTTTLLGEDQRSGLALIRLHPGERSIRYIRCAEGGAGFLCLSRVAVNRLVAGAETYAGERNGQLRHCLDLFKSVVDGGVRIGEDQYVCRRWRALGGEVWCSVDARLSHVGTGLVFDGDYARSLQLRVRQESTQ
jgi:hypothetical protein